MPDAKPGTQTLHDSALGWGIIGIVLFLLFLLFWHYFQYAIKSEFRYFRWSEMWLISWIVGEKYAVNWNGYAINYRDLMHTIHDVPSDQLDANTMDILSYVTFYPARFIFALIMFLMGLWAAMFGPGTQYRRKHDLDGLIRFQAKNFPVISPFVEFNPQMAPNRPPGAPVPEKLPAFAEALSPEEWIAWAQVPMQGQNVDDQAAFVAFSRQLGPRWQGVPKLPPYKQVLLAAFCLKAARKRNEADTLLGRIAQCWSHDDGLQLKKDPDLVKDAQKILRDKGLSEKTLAKCNVHAFETTAMLRGLLTAREEGGVLSPSQFVWLRAHDRTLWYPLNNLGRQAFHMEALGAMCHFKAERLTRRPIPRPKVQDAVKSITTLMRSPVARPIPPLDKKSSKK